jgi:hypothetical protein
MCLCMMEFAKPMFVCSTDANIRGAIRLNLKYATCWRSFIDHACISGIDGALGGSAVPHTVVLVLPNSMGLGLTEPRCTCQSTYSGAHDRIHFPH